ncbi:MAG: hypothetical protein ABSD46_14235 [Bacteroidota bacterium]
MKNKIRNLFVVLTIATSVIIWVIFYFTAPELMVYPLIIGSLAAYLVYEYAFYKVDDIPENFFLFNRKMPERYFVWSFVSTNIGLFSSIAFSVILSFYFGIAGMFWTTFAWFVGMWWFSKAIPKLLPFFKTGNTLHEFIAVKYGNTFEEKKRLRVITSTITSVLYWASLGVEIKFASMILSPSLGVTSSTILAMAIALTAFGYCYMVGYRGAVITDKFQFWAMAIGSIVILGFLVELCLTKPFEISSDYFSLRSILIGPDWFSLLALVLVLVPYQYCIMDMWQRCIAISKMNDTAGIPMTDETLVKEMQKLTYSKAIIPFLYLFVVWFLIGIVALGTKMTDDPSLILQEFLKIADTYGNWGFAVKSVIVLVFISAAISTVSTFLMAIVQTFMYDIYATWIVPDLADRVNQLEIEKQYRFVNISRFFVALIGASGIAVAYFAFDLVNFWVSMYSVMLSMLPAVYLQVSKRLSSIQTKPSYQRVFWGIVVGSTSALVLGILGTFTPLKEYSLANYCPIASIVLSFAITFTGGEK